MIDIVVLNTETHEKKKKLPEEMQTQMSGKKECNIDVWRNNCRSLLRLLADCKQILRTK
jgi:hypothetical protein